MGVVPGTTDLSSPEVVLDAPAGLTGRLPGVEVFSTEVASLKTATCYYKDVAFQVVMPNPPTFIPRILNYVRAKVCPGADPWDHLRLYLSVSDSKKLFFGIIVLFIGFGWLWDYQGFNGY